MSKTVKLMINNKLIEIINGSCSFTEGLGEQVVRLQASGSCVSPVSSDVPDSKFSSIKFEMHKTDENCSLFSAWKKNGSNNVIILDYGICRRIFQHAVIEKNVSVEYAKILQIKFEADPASTD